MAKMISTRTNEVSKIILTQQQEDAEMREAAEQYEWSTDQVRNYHLVNIHEDLQVMNQTLANACDYLGTLANILNSKGGK